MKTIEEYTNYLLNCCFTDDSFDTEEHPYYNPMKDSRILKMITALEKEKT